MEAVTRDQVKDFLKNMSLMDAATLVKELENELGVSAAAPVAIAAAGAAPGGAAAAAPAETPQRASQALTSCAAWPSVSPSRDLKRVSRSAGRETLSDMIDSGN